MDYTQIISMILVIVGTLVVLVNIITEVIKKLIDFKSAQAINVFVTLLSVVLTLAVFLAFWQLKQMTITWYLIAAFIIVGFMVAYAAMFGFDKLLKYFEEIKK